MLCPRVTSSSVQQPIRSFPALFRLFVNNPLNSLHFWKMTLLNFSTVSSPLSMPTPSSPSSSHSNSPHLFSQPQFTFFLLLNFLQLPFWENIGEKISGKNIREFSDTQIVQDYPLHDSIEMERELNLMLVVHIKFNSLPSTGERPDNEKVKYFPF